MGLLNSAGECVRPSLLVLLFADPPYPAGVVLVVILVGPLPITDLVLPSSLGGDFHYTTIITQFFVFFLEIHIFHDLLNISFAKRRLRQRIDDLFYMIKKKLIFVTQFWHMS